jgi:hypothetical protein
MIMNIIISQNLKVSYPVARILNNHGKTLTAFIDAKNLNFLERGQEVTLFERLDQKDKGMGHILRVKKDNNGLIVEIAKTV